MKRRVLIKKEKGEEKYLIKWVGLPKEKCVGDGRIYIR